MVYEKPALFFSELIARTNETTEKMKIVKENSIIFKLKNFGKNEEMVIC
jgi:hypothetical protein